MKKVLLLILTLILSLSLLASCGLPDIPFLPDGIWNGEADDGGNEINSENTETDGGNNETEDSYLYSAFTPSEKDLFVSCVGEIIPFVPNNEYYVEEYEYDWGDEYEEGINFYTFGNTQKEFNNYKSLFSAYTFDYSEADEYGDVWYYYTSPNGFYIDVTYYLGEDGDYVIDVYVYYLSESSGEGGSSDSGSEGENSGNSGDGATDYSYTDFTDSEKSLFEDYFGEVIPFAPNNEYYVEEYEYDWGDECEKGINFYTFGNTQAEFNSYKSLFSAYTYDGTDTDDYGDSWYYYTASEGFYIDVTYYLGEDGDYVIDVYVYYLYESSDDDGSSSSGSGSSSSGSGSSSELPNNVITNANAGLPDGADGVYNIDLTKAEKVKDVTDQGYYIDGCPTTGTPAVLVIPVEFKDVTAESKGYSISNIIRAFTGDDTDYYSVDEYYYISSYGNLDLDITVVNEWFMPQYASSYYKNATTDYYGDTVEIGDQIVMDEALKYLSTIMDLSKFDSDDNGIIDAVVMVNTLTINDESNFNWAYRYWNIYTDDEGYYYEYDAVSANDYLWMSYAFMHESYDESGDVTYTDTDVMNTYTFIHEFGHILGADDYYDTEYSSDTTPLEGCDVMDGMSGDHNAYTKFNYGWLTTSRLVTTDTSVTLSLEDFSKNGDTIIIANNWDDSLGAYQEYYIVVYYTMNGLNGGDYGYFSRNGVIVYHVNASLYSEEYEGETYYDVYNNNTSYTNEIGYGTEDNLIEFVKSAEGNFTYVAGDSLPDQTDDLGNALAYSFTVDSLTENSATITFTKN